MNHSRLPRLSLSAIVAVYVAIGILYAIFTPTWQVPDEPAHYNYVRALAEGHRLPVLESGDYDQELLSQLTHLDFPPELPVEPLEYEDHQPPLYYLLAVPLYLLFGGAVLPLRLLSVALGAGLLAVAFGTVRTIFPQQPELAPMAAAFVAFIPQHIAMTAGVNNDALAELAVGGTLWALVVYVNRDRNRPWPIGLLLGMVLLTKTTGYSVIGVAALAVILRRHQERRTWGWAARQLAWMLIPALALSTPWFMRNGLTYGWLDPLGWTRHNEIVAQQPRSSEWLSLYGWSGLLSRLVGTTFRSFWGQFGWMKVVLPARIYASLTLLVALLCTGFLGWLFDRRRPELTPTQRARLLLLLVSCLLTVLAFLGYNLTFVQHQGRYLFPALIPLSTAAALGLNRLVKVLPGQIQPWTAATLFTGLAALDVYCLFKFIVPFLSR